MRINQTAALFEQATISRVLLNFIKQSLVGKLAFSKSCAIHGVFNFWCYCLGYFLDPHQHHVESMQEESL